MKAEKHHLTASTSWILAMRLCINVNWSLYLYVVAMNGLLYTGAVLPTRWGCLWSLLLFGIWLAVFWTHLCWASNIELPPIATGYLRVKFRNRDCKKKTQKKHNMHSQNLHGEKTSIDCQLLSNNSFIRLLKSSSSSLFLLGKSMTSKDVNISVLLYI